MGKDETPRKVEKPKAREHVAGLDCWCKPERDPEEPAVIIHRLEKPN